MSEKEQIADEIFHKVITNTGKRPKHPLRAGVTAITSGRSYLVSLVDQATPVAVSLAEDRGIKWITKGKGGPVKLNYSPVETGLIFDALEMLCSSDHPIRQAHLRQAGIPFEAIICARDRMREDGNVILI